MKMVHKRMLIRAKRAAATGSFLAVLFAPAITFGVSHDEPEQRVANNANAIANTPSKAAP